MLSSGSAVCASARSCRVRASGVLLLWLWLLSMRACAGGYKKNECDEEERGGRTVSESYFYYTIGEVGRERIYVGSAHALAHAVSNGCASGRGMVGGGRDMLPRFSFFPGFFFDSLKLFKVWDSAGHSRRFFTPARTFRNLQLTLSSILDPSRSLPAMDLLDPDLELPPVRNRPLVLAGRICFVLFL